MTWVDFRGGTTTAFLSGFWLGVGITGRDLVVGWLEGFAVLRMSYGQSLLVGRASWGCRDSGSGRLVGGDGGWRSDPHNLIGLIGLIVVFHPQGMHLWPRTYKPV